MEPNEKSTPECASDMELNEKSTPEFASDMEPNEKSTPECASDMEPNEKSTPEFASDMEPNEKKLLINDNIHGHIHLDWRLKKIIDTPQMQRLRDLKQLGLGSHVYPGATHTRFAHVIGVCHLAGKFFEQLRISQPNLGITDRDVFCVQVAGLCHDLGHGPFSHLFERTMKAADKQWKHEDMSRQLFEMMVRENKLEHLFEEGEINFIKELIESEEKDRKGRGPDDQEKEFLYEIVNNKRTGLDVDKFDYFARDSLSLGLTNQFSYERFMKMARVLRCEDDKLHICHRDKELENLIVMFQTRVTLHMYASRHPVVCAIDKMVSDAFEAANEYLLTEGDDGRLYRLFDCADNLGAFVRLNDSIIFRIQDLWLSVEDHLNHPKKVEKVKAAQLLVKRIMTRRLYKFVYQRKRIPFDENWQGETIEREIFELGKGKFNKEDIYVQVPVIGFGMEEKKPFKKLSVYSKHKPNEAKPFHKSMVSLLMMPTDFSEKIIRVYSKSEKQEATDAIRLAAIEWDKRRIFPPILLILSYNVIRRKGANKSQYWDDCGAWGNGAKASTPSTLYTRQNGLAIHVVKRKGKYCQEKQSNGKKVYKAVEPQPASEDVLTLPRNYSKHAHSNDYVRRVTWLEENQRRCLHE
ncbi:sam domain and hd domain-containing protein 1 [Plakobranchus ocellatus]|uniref:Sam domain and hd domain-containing protein 1 n=1 Tax=Plakobranchus ocellatus TaxID=259542 RepID=A0AAV3YAT2_9GAST|nr:sam domain and hd domain-containing protein 1 [Plakobranchus ocellatus]